jgi:hypothetical protein
MKAHKEKTLKNPAVKIRVIKSLKSVSSKMGFNNFQGDQKILKKFTQFFKK